jgi:parallel beta-helix repeat protein
VKNVRAENCGKRCVDAWFDVYRNEIRDSYFVKVIDHEDSDNYAVQIENGTGNLVENNIFHDTSNGIVLVSASGNVFGYNYMHGVHRTQSGQADWFWPDSWTHGAHSSFNLWEGNDENAIEWDWYWGSNSHNLAYRNRLHGMDETVDYDLANLQAVGAIVSAPDNNYMTEVGNVLGTAGFNNEYEDTEVAAGNRPIWAMVRSQAGTTSDDGKSTTLRHMNYDYVTSSTKRCDEAGEPGCQGGDGSAELPASCYRASKPAWFGAAAWPPVGPDVDGFATANPARACFEATPKAADGTLIFDGAACYGE